MDIDNNDIKKLPFIKLMILIFILIIFYDLIKFTSLIQYASLENLKNSRNYLRVLSSNWWFPILFVAIYIVGVITSFPGLILTVSGGIIFGVFKGTFLNIIASNIGASIAFMIGRYLGRGIVEKLLKDKFKSIDNIIGEKGFMTILRLRLIPLVPFNMLNYASGFSKIKYKDYALGSLIGMFPSTFIYTFFADAIIIDPIKQKEAFLKLFLAAGLLIMLSFIPNFFKTKINNINN